MNRLNDTDVKTKNSCDVVTRAIGEAAKRPEVTSFFDEPSNTASHVVRSPVSRRCAVIDSVLDYEAASVHADHLSAAPYIKKRLGGALGIGENIRVVQDVFGKVFNAGTEFQRDGSQFDHLFIDGELFAIGDLDAVALHTPGHTPACVTYVIGDAAFVGDTLFMPDYGTARADFPGGDARTLYRSARRILSLPGATRLFLCHDYKAPGRSEFRWETTVADERAHNVHIHDGVGEGDFVRIRTARDAQLGMPKLILPSVQVNMRAGEFPPAEDDGQTYLKIPLNQL